MTNVQLKCFKCGKESEFTDFVGFRDECEYCHEDSHCCMNCKFYTPKVYNECSEPSAEVVRGKDHSNFCDFFQPGSGKKGVGQSREELLQTAEALFKKK